jgi:hypothetical protein
MSHSSSSTTATGDWVIFTATVRTFRERKGAYRALVGKPEGRRLFGRPRRRWEDNNKIDLREV